MAQALAPSPPLEGFNIVNNDLVCYDEDDEYEDDEMEGGEMELEQTLVLDTGMFSVKVNRLLY